MFVNWNNISAYYISSDGEVILKEEKKKKSCFPEDGEFAKYFSKEMPKDQLTFTMTAEELLGLIRHEMSSTSVDESDPNCIYWSMNFNAMNGGFDIFEAERVTNNSLLALLMNKYKVGDEKISKDLEHKLIWLYPPFAEAFGLENISYQGKLLYLYRRPNGIRNFSKSTTEMQMIAVRSSWDLIRGIKRPHVDTLNEAAKRAISYYERKAVELRKWSKGELSDYETKDLKKDYKFFSKYKFDPIIKQDLLGTIMSIFLEHEMTPFI